MYCLTLNGYTATLYYENGEIAETEHYPKEIKFPIILINPNNEYTVCLNLDDADQWFKM